MVVTRVLVWMTSPLHGTPRGRCWSGAANAVVAEAVDDASGATDVPAAVDRMAYPAAAHISGRNPTTRHVREERSASVRAR